MNTLADAGAANALKDRMMRLTENSPRGWGTLTAPEMLCHLRDSFQAALGERHIGHVDSWLARTIFKFIALHTNLPTLKGMPTMPEVNPKKSGSQPGRFEDDRNDVCHLINRFTLPTTVYSPHPAFGPLSRGEWLIWGYRHVDHHLRQFGA